MCAVDELLASPDVPQDAKLIVLILKSMGVTQYDPAVVVQLLEFTHRYAVEILSDAMQYAAHAETKSTIDIADLKMAIQARVNTSFTPAPSREVGGFEAWRLVVVKLTVVLFSCF